jgi:hypothetical protein
MPTTITATAQAQAINASKSPRPAEVLHEPLKYYYW